jgi:ribosomal protein L37AE/L43A
LRALYGQSNTAIVTAISQLTEGDAQAALNTLMLHRYGYSLPGDFVWKAKDERIKPKRDLREGETVQIGDLTFRFWHYNQNDCATVRDANGDKVVVRIEDIKRVEPERTEPESFKIGDRVVVDGTWPGVVMRIDENDAYRYMVLPDGAIAASWYKHCQLRHANCQDAAAYTRPLEGLLAAGAHGWLHDIFVESRRAGKHSFAEQFRVVGAEPRTESAPLLGSYDMRITALARDQMQTERDIDALQKFTIELADKLTDRVEALEKKMRQPDRIYCGVDVGAPNPTVSAWVIPGAAVVECPNCGWKRLTNVGTEIQVCPMCQAHFSYGTGTENCAPDAPKPAMPSVEEQK